MGKVQKTMGEDVLRSVPTHLQMPDEECQMRVDNEVLLLLQDELEAMGTCLERFGLPTPDKQNRIHRISRVIAEEMYDIEG